MLYQKDWELIRNANKHTSEMKRVTQELQELMKGERYEKEVETGENCNEVDCSGYSKGKEIFRSLLQRGRKEGL